MSPSNEKQRPADSTDPLQTRSVGLPEDIRTLMKSKRIERGHSLRALAARVGISAGALTRIESGEKHPTPHLFLKILAELDYADHFERVVSEPPESWIARRFAMRHSDPQKLGACLRRARVIAKITMDQLAERTGVSIHKLELFENGYITPSVALLVKIFRAWDLPSSVLSSLLDSTGSPGSDFAERFIATTLERHGFEVTPHQCGSGINVALGGKWHFHITAELKTAPYDQ